MTNYSKLNPQSATWDNGTRARIILPDDKKTFRIIDRETGKAISKIRFRTLRGAINYAEARLAARD